MREWAFETWLNEVELNKLEYSGYWNNEENEKSKEWYILDGNFSKMEEYLQRCQLPHDLMRCLKILNVEYGRSVGGVGIDAGAGTLWAAPYLLQAGHLEKLYCLEYSRHRLLKIGPKVLEHYVVPKEKVTLVCGSFYDLHVKERSVDFVFMGQAFHHAERPEQLLSEIHRILKPEGIVVIIGEHIVNWVRFYVKYWTKWGISAVLPAKIQERFFSQNFQVGSFWPGPKDISPPNEPGDHYYTDRQYRVMFSKHGFRILKHFKNRRSKSQSFVLVAT